MTVSSIVNLSGTRSGNIIIGEINRSQPRAYSARCALCSVSFTLAHSTIKGRLDSNVQLECPNAACRLGILKHEAQEQENFRQLRARQEQAEELAFDARMRVRYGPQVTVGAQ